MRRRPDKPSAFGQQLRHWRRLRRLSQLALAQLADTTPRHLSFIETGRSRPGRDLVLRLASALDVPVRERNALLTAAGLESAFPERSLEHRDQEPVRSAVLALLERHDPYPAVALDARGHIHTSNRAYRRLFPGLETLAPLDAVEVLFASWGPEHIENWPEVAWALADRYRVTAAASLDPELADLSERAHAFLRDTPRPAASFDPDAPVICARTRLRGEVVETFTTVLRFETAQDVTVSELRVEMIFPAGERSGEILRRWASEDPT